MTTIPPHAPAPRPTDDVEPGGGLSLLQVTAFLIRNLVLVISLPVLAAVVTAVVVVLLPRSYVSSATFVPQTEEPTLSTLSGLAAQLGVGGLGGAGESPAFYADLVISYGVLSAVAARSYEFTVDGRRYAGDLPEVLGIQSEDPEPRTAGAVGTILKDLEVRTRSNGIVEVRVELPYAPLAQAVAAAILVEINRFNVERRQSRASAERRFVEERLAAVRAEYREAEDTLGAFLDRNRQFENSLPLSFEYERLGREVALRQQILLTLAQSYEQARIDQVRNTPVITVIEQPRLPLSPKGRFLMLKALTAAFLGFLVAVALAAIWEPVRRSRDERRADYLELQGALGQIVGSGRRGAA